MEQPPEVFTWRDVITGLLSLAGVLLSIIFKSHNERLKVMEQAKADAKAVDDRFHEIVRRLDQQDRNAENRDAKIDRILERLPPRAS